MKYQSLITASLLIGSSTAFALDYDAVAKKACDCVSGAYAKVEELKPAIMEAVKVQDMSKIMMIQGEMMQHMGAVNICFGKLTEEHAHIANDPEERGKVEAIMNENCPRPEFDMQGMMTQ